MPTCASGVSAEVGSSRTDQRRSHRNGTGNVHPLLVPETERARLQLCDLATQPDVA